MYFKELNHEFEHILGFVINSTIPLTLYTRYHGMLWSFSRDLLATNKSSLTYNCVFQHNLVLELFIISQSCKRD